jgi:hypothetical protein
LPYRAPHVRGAPLETFPPYKKGFIMTATATSTEKFHEFYVIDRDRDDNRAIVVYRDMIECDESMVIEVTENGCHVFRG